MALHGIIRDLRFAEPRVLAEQVRLLLENVVSSTLTVVLLSALMTFTLSNADNVAAMYTWFATVVLSKLASYVVARRALAAPMPLPRSRRLAQAMIVFYTVNGVAWGSLPWLTMDNATPAGRVLALAVMAGVIGSAMAQTSSVLAVFLAFAGSTLSLVVVKLLLMDDPAYVAFAGATFLYFMNLMPLARNNATAALSAIRLRFENTDLMEQLRAETELSHTTRCEAERANKAKSRFLAAASHDLRQPIHAQGLFLNVLASTPLDQQQRTLVESIRKASEASGEMLSTLLDFSRIEAGVVKPHLESMRLQPLLRKLEDELAPQANAKGIIYRTRDTELMVCSDPALLELILRNFITNAIRYTERGGLLVGCRHRKRTALLEVWDTGIGIDTAQQREVFREFHQLGNPERDSRKGLGLGLAIADGLARTLDHRLSMDSLPRRGSVFRLELPLADTESLQDGAAANNPVGTKLAGVRVLVIDDDEAIREGMVHLLGDWGCECDTAESIEAALAAAHRRAPDVIISDYRLREQRTGTEAITAVRALLDRSLPALLITGDTAPERLREAEAGGVPLLHKPVAAHQLQHALWSALEEQRKTPPALVS